jgi:hypothetical protein
VLDVHLGIVVGVGEFDPSTGALLQRIKEQIVGITAAPEIGQSGNFSMTITAAELQSAGVSSTNRVGIFIDHDGAGTPGRNDVYIVDNLFLTLLGGESDTDEDGIPDSAEPGLGLDPNRDLDLTRTTRMTEGSTSMGMARAISLNSSLVVTFQIRQTSSMP